jgi:hypothetical protein
VSACIFSVDVEDYFQVEAFSGVVDRADWSSYSSRVVGGLVELFEPRRR